jgi:hypothetical protein
MDCINLLCLTAINKLLLICHSTNGWNQSKQLKLTSHRHLVAKLKMKSIIPPFPWPRFTHRHSFAINTNRFSLLGGNRLTKKKKRLFGRHQMIRNESIKLGFMNTTSRVRVVLGISVQRQASLPAKLNHRAAVPRDFIPDFSVRIFSTKPRQALTGRVVALWSVHTYSNVL